MQNRPTPVAPPAFAKPPALDPATLEKEIIANRNSIKARQLRLSDNEAKKKHDITASLEGSPLLKAIKDLDSLTSNIKRPEGVGELISLEESATSIIKNMYENPHLLSLYKSEWVTNKNAFNEKIAALKTSELKDLETALTTETGNLLEATLKSKNGELTSASDADAKKQLQSEIDKLKEFKSHLTGTTSQEIITQLKEQGLDKDPAIAGPIAALEKAQAKFDNISKIDLDKTFQQQLEHVHKEIKIQNENSAVRAATQHLHDTLNKLHEDKFLSSIRDKTEHYYIPVDATSEEKAQVSEGGILLQKWEAEKRYMRQGDTSGFAIYVDSNHWGCPSPNCPSIRFGEKTFHEKWDRVIEAAAAQSDTLSIRHHDMDSLKALCEKAMKLDKIVSITQLEELRTAHPEFVEQLTSHNARLSTAEKKSLHAVEQESKLDLIQKTIDHFDTLSTNIINASTPDQQLALMQQLTEHMDSSLSLLKTEDLSHSHDKDKMYAQQMVDKIEASKDLIVEVSGGMTRVSDDALIKIKDNITTKAEATAAAAEEFKPASRPAPAPGPGSP